MPKQQRRTFTAEFKKQMFSSMKTENPEPPLSRNITSQPPRFRSLDQAVPDLRFFKEKDNRSPEENELNALRKENQRLKMENDILKQAALIMGRK